MVKGLGTMALNWCTPHSASVELLLEVDSSEMFLIQSWTAKAISERNNGGSWAAVIVLLRCYSRTAYVRRKLGVFGLFSNAGWLVRRLNIFGGNVAQVSKNCTCAVHLNPKFWGTNSSKSRSPTGGKWRWWASLVPRCHGIWVSWRWLLRWRCKKRF